LKTTNSWIYNVVIYNHIENKNNEFDINNGHSHITVTVPV